MTPLIFALCLAVTPAAALPAERDPASEAVAQRAAIEKQTFLYATKDGEPLRLDRYVDRAAPVSGKRPVLIFSFGGGWETGRRDEPAIVDFAEHFAARGYVVVSIDYRLGIKAAKAKGEMNAQTGMSMYFRAIDWGVEDLFDATTYITRQADTWGIDPTRIVISGSSAGATNSLVAVYNQVNQTDLARAHLPKDFRYAGAISMAGAIWLPNKTPLTWKSAPPPVQFFHGAKDQLVTYDEFQDGFSGYGPVYIQRQFAAQGFSSWFVDLPEADHVMSFAPMFDYRADIEGFLTKMVRERQEMTIHTVETDKTPKTFANFVKLYGAALKAAESRAAQR